MNKSNFLKGSFLALSILFLSACQNTVRDMGANVLVSVGNNYMTPWFFASDDLDVFCGLGEGMSGLAFPMGPNIDPLLPMLTLATGVCAEERGIEEELRYLRAVYNKNGETALDARSAQQRWLNVAAKRHYIGFQAAVRAYGEPNAKDGCPRLKNEHEELSYLFGMMNGLLATFSDLASGSQANIPLNLIPRVGAAMDCLDNVNLWGIPTAVTATIDILLASAGGDGDQAAIDAGWRKLENAASIGDANGIRLVDFLYATIYMTLGDLDATKALIAEHVADKAERPANPALNLLDDLATRRLRLLSDRLWTQNTGHRTPYGKLGTFWDDKLDTGDLDIDDLL